MGSTRDRRSEEKCASSFRSSQAFQAETGHLVSFLAKGISFAQTAQETVAEAVIVVSLPGRRTITARKEAKTFEEAIRAGFDAVAIKVRKHHDKRSRTEIRTPPIPPLRGVVCKLYPAKGYGFILKEGGGEVYFHKHALHDLSFSELEDGLEVAFNIEPGKKGLQATTVNPIPVTKA